MRLHVDTDTSIAILEALGGDTWDEDRAGRRRGTETEGAVARRVKGLLRRPGYACYLRHRFESRTREEREALALGELASLCTHLGSRRAGQGPRLDLAPEDFQEICHNVRAAFHPMSLTDRVRPWAEAPGQHIDLTLVLDTDCVSIAKGRFVWVDLLTYWRREVPLPAVVDSAIAGLYRCVSTLTFRSIFETSSAFRSWGEIAALVLLHRLILAGIVHREILSRSGPPSAEGCDPGATSRSAPDSACTWLERTLSELRYGLVRPEQAADLLRRMERGAVPAVAVLGSALLDELQPDRDQMRAWSCDPRGISSALAARGFPAGLATWCAGIARAPAAAGGGARAIRSSHRGVRVAACTVEAEAEERDAGGREPRASAGSIGRGAALTIAVAAGGIHDPAGGEGLAHCVEHLVHARLLRVAGGTIPLQAITEKELALYVARLDAVDGSVASDLLRAVLDPLDPDRGSFARVRGEIEAELGERSSNSLARTEGAIEGDLLRAPYGRALTGTAQSIGRLSRERARAFHRRCYRPGRTVVAVIGAPPASLFLARGGPATRPYRPLVACARGPQWTWRSDGASFWILARTVPGKDDATHRPVAALGRYVGCILRERFEGRVRFSSTYFVGKGIWRFRAYRDSGVTAIDLVSFLRHAVASAADADLKAAARAEGKIIGLLPSRADNAGLWLAARGLLLPRQWTTPEVERRTYEEVAPAAMRACAERLLTIPAIPAVPAEVRA